MLVPNNPVKIIVVSIVNIGNNKYNLLINKNSELMHTCNLINKLTINQKMHQKNIQALVGKHNEIKELQDLLETKRISFKLVNVNLDYICYNFYSIKC